MKFNLLIKTAFILCVFFLLINTTFAFDDLTTHPAITDEIVDFYNLSSQNKLNTEQKEWIVQGVMAEDTPPRWVNHFYDPIYNVGWTGVNTGRVPSWMMRYLAGNFLSFTSPVSAINWLHNQELQSEYYNYGGNRTWERALYEYTSGNEEEAYKTLGHILHLMEDMAVPDHTRDDPHAHEARGITGDYGSPFEEYAKEFNRENFEVASDLVRQGFAPVQKDNIDNYFYSLANYSNDYFFSKDTINDPKYSNPKIVREDREFGYGKDESGEEFILIKVEIAWDEVNKEYVKSFELKNAEKKYQSILSQYFTRLSREAVIYGAGVIDLFFREIEMIESGEKEIPRLFVEEDRNIVKKIITLDTGLGNVSVTGEFFKIVNFTADTYDKTKKVFSNTIFDIVSLLQNDNNKNQQSAVIESQKNPFAGGEEEQEIVVKDTEDKNPPVGGEDPPADTKETNTEIVTTTESASPADMEKTTKEKGSENFNEDGLIPIYTPFFGGGGGGSRESNNENSQQEVAVSLLSPLVLTPPSNPHTSTSTTIVFTGEAEAGVIVNTEHNNLTVATTTDEAGNWTLSLTDFSQGANTIAFSAEDTNGNVSASSTERIVFVDSFAPDILLTAENCSATLATDGCLTATTTLSFSWSSSAEDFLYFILNQNGEIATTTATSTIVIANNNIIYIMSVQAVDAFGNVSEADTEEVEVATLPVVINEVAWMGTAISTYDEWIELYNNTNKTISLEGWVLRAEDNTPYIQLSDTILAGDYYLLERKDNQTVSDISANFTYGNDGSSWALNNSGEDLILERVANGATTTIDSVPQCSSDWCGGYNFNSGTRHTMERIGPLTSGDEPSNWGSAIGEFILNGEDANGDPIKGTPKARNSISYLIGQDGTLSENKTLTKANSPYLVDRLGLQISGNATLTVEAGVVIKIVNPTGPSISVEGSASLITQGTTAEPVVFTSFADDEYGGDMNADATSTPPGPGNWRKILLTSTSDNSSFQNTIVRYGGEWFTGMDMKASVAVDETNVSFDNIIIEYSGGHGLYLRNSESTVENSTFRYATSTTGPGSTPAAGLYIGAGAPTISNNEFTENTQGLQVSSAPSAIISGNTFTDNKDEAIYVSGAVSSFSDNTGSGNGLNAIIIGNNNISGIAQVGTTTLKANTIPYLVSETAYITASSTLAFEDGVVVKAYGNISNRIGHIIVKDGGSIVHNSFNPNDVIFTSIHDDTVGSAIDTATTSPSAGDWYGITVNSGGTLSLNGFTLKYAGRAIGSPAKRDGIRIETGNSTTTIANALIENNLQIGVFAENATLDISNTTIRNHPQSGIMGEEIGLYFAGSSVSLSDMIFENNQIDISSNSSSVICLASCGSPTTTPADLFD